MQGDKFIFPLNPSNARSLFNAHYRGPGSQFLEAIKTKIADPTVNRLTAILINHGSLEGSFGGKTSALSIHVLF